TITAGDYSFEGVPETMTAGIQNVTFENKGSVNHELAFAKVKEGTTSEALFDALGKVIQGQPFPAFLEAANGVHDADPGKTSVSQSTLTAGEWAALGTDTGAAGTKKDGKPHFSRGMYKKVTVTGDGGTEPPTADASITAHDYGFTLTGLKAGKQTVAFNNT